jgi:hypothetical protein
MHRPWEWSVARRAWLPLAAFAAAGLWLAARETVAQRPVTAETTPQGGLWISAGPLDDSRRLLLVIDPQLKNAAVYHVDAAAGTLTLKSTRDISYDLMVGDFNAQPPKPADLQKMLELAPPRR